MTNDHSMADETPAVRAFRSVDDATTPPTGAPPATESDLIIFLRAAWQGRWIVLATTLIFAAGMATYTLLATPWYRAKVSLLPVERTPGAGGLMGQLGNLAGLASIAGVNLGGSEDAEPAAVLKSQDFARTFIEKKKLLPILFANKWDEASGRWKTSPEKTPDLRDAVEYFEKHVRRVGEDRKSGLITVTVDWKDPSAAAEWANEMALQINEQMRERALKDAAASIAYLRSELEATNQVSLQQAIGRLLESQMQNMMVARGNVEYAFRVVDSAHPPKKRFKPQRTLLTLGAALIGAFLATGYIALFGRKRKPS